MQLEYLLFDATDDDTGSASFDALASALPDRLPELLREAEAVLAWAHRAFGAPSADEGEWDFALQAADDEDRPLELAYDAASAHVRMPAGAQARVTLALTLGGTAAFAAAFRDAFPQGD